jgi:Flp pilus assembly protein TadD
VEREALETLAANPTDWSALLDMAKCRARQQRADEALEYATRACEAAPGEAEPHSLLGHLLLGRARQLPKAFDHLNQAIRIRPDDVKSHVGLGMAWRRRGDFGAAGKSFTTAHELAPKDPFPLFQLGVLAADRGDATKAAEMFRKTLSVEPRFEAARDALDRLAARRPGGPTEPPSK